MKKLLPFPGKHIKKEVAFEILFKEYYPNLTYYASHFLPEDEAEDIVQDTFFELWKRWNSIETGENISSYLYKLVYNKTMNVINRKKVEEKYSELLQEINQHKLEFYEQYNDSILKKIENRELEEGIKGEVDNLPEQCRRIFKMSYLHGMKNQEIADILGISLRTVESHMYKALRILRSKLKHFFFIVFFFL